MESILVIDGYGGWNGGRVVDNSYFENSGLTFKNKIPVTGRAIEDRIGVRTRRVASAEAGASDM